MKKKGLDTKEKIIRTAVGLLRRTCLKDLGQLQVAKEAQVSQGHLTYYFPKRADLILAVAERAVLSISELVSKALPTELKAVTRKRVLSLVEEALNDEAQTRALLGILVESDGSPELLKKLREKSTRETNLVAMVSGRETNDPRVILVHSALLGLAIQLYLWRGTRADLQIKQSLQVLSEWLNPDKGEVR